MTAEETVTTGVGVAIAAGVAYFALRPKKRRTAVAGFAGLAGNCHDPSGRFIPIPACTGRRVPGQATTKKKCAHGRVKSGPRKGLCRKNKKR
jgi:hypothetical protein